jgi:hypothetical protein
MLRRFVGFFAFFMVTINPVPSFANDWKSGLGLGFEQMQKLWKGVSVSRKMTECRLASRKAYKGKQICVYKGANKTFVAVYNDANGYCSSAMQCRYDPDSRKTVRSLVLAFTEAQDKVN